MGLCTGFSFLSGVEVVYHVLFGLVDVLKESVLDWRKGRNKKKKKKRQEANKDASSSSNC